MFRSIALVGTFFGQSAKSHCQPAKLHRDIGTFGKRVDRFAPILEPFVQLALIAGDPQRGAAMVEHDLLVGKGPREIDEVAQLRFEQPGIERQIMLGIGGKPSPERIRRIQTFGGVERRT